MTFAERRTKSIRDDWRTPAEEIALVKRIFGGQIDLDPCADDDMNNWIAITNAHPTGHDGLKSYWFGKVFINPPYGRAIIDWVRKGRHEYTDAQIWLVPGRAMDSKWWRELMTFCKVFAIKRKRNKFGGAACGAMFPSTLCYCGPNEDRFVDEARSAGWDVYRNV